MSKESVEVFLDRLTKDPALERQVQDAAKDATDPTAAIVSVAARNGYEFTTDEFLQSQVPPDGELTDAELAAVSGGLACPGYVVRRRGDFEPFELTTPTAAIRPEH
jgi:predicted ribosomally synthesized peptide with nif11-like leader